MFAASKTDSVSGAAPADAQFNYVTMLLHGDGTNGAQNNTFLDSSTNNFTITRNGNPTQGSFSPYGSGWSASFNGSNYQNFFTNSSADFNFSAGQGNFCVEFWVNPIGFPGTGEFGRLWQTSLAGTSDYINTFLFGDGKIYWRDTAGTELVTPTAHGMAVGVWYHLAFVRASTTYSIYLNGVLLATGAPTAVITNVNASFLFATNAGFNQGCNLWASNIRVVKGEAVYTTTFSPSTTPLTTSSQGVTAANTKLLTLQNNRFLDNSTSSPKTFSFGNAGANIGTRVIQRFNPFGTSTAYSTANTGGSVYFDASSDYLSANQSAFVATGDCTLECWFYQINQTAGFQGIVSTAAVSGSTGFRITTDNNTLTMWFNNSSITSAYVPQNQWNHVAISRTGTGSNNVSFYLNGNRIGQATNTSSTTNSSLVVGMYYNDLVNYLLNGYISDVRLISGSGGGIYSGATITVPTAPLTAVTDTKLLLNATNAGIVDNAMMNDLETVGNAQISTSVKKYGTGSLKFNGSSDYLTLPVNPLFDPGPGNFTIDGWIYPLAYPSAGQGAGIIDRGQSAGYALFSVNLRSNGNIEAYMSRNNGLAVPNIITAGSVSLNTWTHFAFVKTSNTYVLYINGTSVGTVTNADSPANNSGLATRVGIASTYFNGYMDDIRITKGFARYTANFTPPIATLPDTGPY